MGAEGPDYEEMIIRLPAYPSAESMGTWWRRRWHFSLRVGEWEREMIPPPLIGLRDIAIVVTATRISSTELIVETFTVNELMTGDELTYLSTVAAWFAHKYSAGAILLEGMVNHPLLSMSRLSPEVVAMLERSGY